MRPLRHMAMTWSTQKITSLATTLFPLRDLRPPRHVSAPRAGAAETPSPLVPWSPRCR